VWPLGGNVKSSWSRGVFGGSLLSPTPRGPPAEPPGLSLSKRTTKDAMSPALETQFADYAAFHRTKGNKACHYVGIPLIVLSLLALLSALPLAQWGGFTLTAAEVVVAAATVYYATLDLTLALLMLAATLLLDGTGRFVPMSLAFGLFALGWTLQYIGHYRYEKQSPAFYRNLVHLLVGPLWILARATRRA
jgi:uncharacterized membrane protein YGL010W